MVTRVTVRHDFNISVVAMRTVTDQDMALGPAAALATGALIGGAIATQDQGYYPVQTYPAYSDQGYYPVQTYPAYSDPGYVYSDAAPTVYNNGGSVAYCEQTYRSYDPASGSYLGYDGFRHPCP